MRGGFACTLHQLQPVIVLLWLRSTSGDLILGFKGFYKIIWVQSWNQTKSSTDQKHWVGESSNHGCIKAPVGRIKSCSSYLSIVCGEDQGWIITRADGGGEELFFVSQPDTGPLQHNSHNNSISIWTQGLISESSVWWRKCWTSALKSHFRNASLVTFLDHYEKDGGVQLRNTSKKYVHSHLGVTWMSGERSRDIFSNSRDSAFLPSIFFSSFLSSAHHSFPYSFSLTTQNWHSYPLIILSLHFSEAKLFARPACRGCVTD